MPDIIDIGPQEYYALADKDALLDLTDVMKTDPEFQDRIKNDFQPNLMNAILFKGKYAAILGWCNPVIMYYNKDIFDKEKLKYPDSTWDWNTFVNNCKN